MEEFFDAFIYYNPKWLYIYPQLQVEYFINEEGFVEKRSKYNLIKFTEDNIDEEDGKFIKHLLNKNRKINKSC